MNTKIDISFRRTLRNVILHFGVYLIFVSSSYGGINDFATECLEIDSIMTLLHNDTEHSDKLTHMLDLARQFLACENNALNGIDSARLYANLVISLAEQTNSPGAKINAVILLGKILTKEEKFDEALSLLNENAILLVENGRSKSHSLFYKVLGKVYKERAFTYGNIVDLDSAKVNFEKALKFAGESISVNDVVEILLGQATISHYAYQNEESVKTLLSIIDNYGDDPDLKPSLLGRTYVNLSMDYVRLGDDEQAISFLQESLRLNNDPFVNRAAHKVMGEIYEKQGKIKEANENFLIALDLIKDDEDPLTYNILDRLGKISIQLEAYDNGIVYYKRAIEIAKNFPNTYEYLSVPSIYGLGLIYFRNGQLNESKQNTAKVIAFLSSKQDNVHYSRFKKVLRDAYFLMSQINEKQLQYDQSLYNYKQYAKIQTEIEHAKDSIFNLEKLKTIEQLELASETAKKDREISNLKTASNIQKLKNEQQLYVGIGLLIGSLFLFLFLFITLKSLKQKKQSHKIIEEKYEENKLLIQEIHHRVKNNFQIIISLLSAQEMSLKNDEKLKATLQESQNKIKSMAMVHQRLYQSATYSKVEVNSYVQELLQQLKNTFMGDENIIHFDIDVDNSDVNMSLAVPLGLIINELLTNSFKYAFVDKNKMDRKVAIQFKPARQSNVYKLKVVDNGVGLPSNFDLDQSSSFGLHLIKGLVGQLNGSMTLNGNDSTGTGFEIYLEEPQMV
ncbi:MAG: histidine kinase dimerization/phosphoacceptor domain -containing protein [Bacteroidota bacterium]